MSELYKDEHKKGSYAGVRFSNGTVAAVEQYAKDNKIPKPLKSEKYHTTLLYSHKHLPEYKAAGKYDKPMKGTPTGFEVWKGQNGSNCLVLTYDCSELYQRHHKLMMQHGATYDFSTYQPHITLSYDVGDLKVDKLPKFEDSIEITDEYQEDLDLGWANED